MVSISLRSTAPKADALIRRATELDPAIPAKTLGFGGEKGQVLAWGSPGGQVEVFVVLDDDASTEDLRVALAKAIGSVKANKIAVDLGELDEEQLAAAAESIQMASYEFSTYRRSSAPKDTRLSSVTIVGSPTKQAKAAITRGQTIGLAVCTARDWVNTPPADLRPPAFAEIIKDTAVEGVEVKVWDEKKLAKEGCGGILAVGRGSDAPPRIVKLSYTPAKATHHLALVGKGITFDSGGLSIKTGVGMQTMKCDMAGAAAVVAAVNAIATLGIPVTVTAFACLAENMPSGSATRPGDVATMRNGRTVEILNTDAEGRMALGDGLSLAAELTPDRIIDVATLTGAAMAALGRSHAAILGNDDYFEERVFAAAGEAGELMWRLPITEEVTSQLKGSTLADLRQIGTKPYGGALFAAAFLREFVGSTSWAHLDIAGPAFNEGSPSGYTPAGGTGSGVRTLIQVASGLA